MKLPLYITPGDFCFQLIDANGRGIARYFGDSEDAREDLKELMNAMNNAASPFWERTPIVRSLADRFDPQSSHYDPDA